MEHFAIHKLSKTHTSLLPKVSNSLCCGNPNSTVYFYHSDHLGSASWITDGNGTPVQHLQYMPYGEPFVNEKTTSYEERSYSPLLCYRSVTTALTAQIPAETLSQSHRLCFIGKERDSETGFSYFGARYYDSDLMTGWLSVDPLADKYPNISPYAYCAWNPILFKDPDGKEKIISFKINATDLLKRKDERFLDDAARHYTRNIGVIHIFAHGAIDKKNQKCVGFWTYQDGDISNAILDPQELDGYLRDNSAIYRRNNKESEVSKTSILVLHSCRTGEQGSIAQQASADLNLLIIAPSEDVDVSKASPDGYKENVSNDGVWNVYYKGELMECFDGKTKPLFNNVEKTIEKYETMYQERHRQSFD